MDKLFNPKVPRRLSGSRDSGFDLCYLEGNNDSGIQRGCSDAEFEDVGWSEILDADMISSRNIGVIDHQRDLDYMFSENKRCHKSN